MTTIKLEKLVTKSFANTADETHALRNRIKSAVVESLVVNPEEEIVFEYLHPDYSKYAMMINALADMILRSYTDKFQN